MAACGATALRWTGKCVKWTDSAAIGTILGNDGRYYALPASVARNCGVASGGKSDIGYIVTRPGAVWEFRYGPQPANPKHYPKVTWIRAITPIRECGFARPDDHVEVYQQKRRWKQDQARKGARGEEEQRRAEEQIAADACRR